MISNVWEGQLNSDKLKAFHDSKIEEVSLPKWMKIDCPICKKKMPPRAIRSFSLKFNSRNFGDIAIEVACPECNRMETIYFRNAFTSIKEAITYLTVKAPSSKPITEEEMYKLHYNNLMEEMYGDNSK